MWLEKRLGPGFAHNVSVINLDGQPVADSDLADLAGLDSLWRLYLNGTPIDDAGMVHLRGLSGLEVLEIRETTVGDAGLAHLAGLTNSCAFPVVPDAHRQPRDGLALAAPWPGGAEPRGDGRRRRRPRAPLRGRSGSKVLRLGRTKVTDAGLAHLAKLNALECLDLSRTAVTDAGLADSPADRAPFALRRRDGRHGGGPARAETHVALGPDHPLRGHVDGPTHSTGDVPVLPKKTGEVGG